MPNAGLKPYRIGLGLMTRHRLGRELHLGLTVRAGFSLRRVHRRRIGTAATDRKVAIGRHIHREVRTPHLNRPRVNLTTADRKVIIGRRIHREVRTRHRGRLRIGIAATDRKVGNSGIRSGHTVGIPGRSDITLGGSHIHREVRTRYLNRLRINPTATDRKVGDGGIRHRVIRSGHTGRFPSRSNITLDGSHTRAGINPG
ncbi:hypothetical protein [Sinosporangium siamense]|uniref:hypothetical protein n=1 Tax=Sinosporangium siamense TaxID=1367973 RepID=UPI0019502D4D|nr:hypothetical protein [Sinosporangium siamense]